MNRFDLVIAGGGIVGATLACALEGSGLRIAVINAEAMEPGAGTQRQRVSALTAGSVAQLERLGVWSEALRRGAQAFREMHVSDGEAFVHFDAAAVGRAYLGVIVENHALLDALWRRLHALEQVELRAPAQVRSLHIRGEAAVIELTTGEHLHATLVVGADGVRSRVRQAAGLPSTGWRYDQTAIVATVGIGESHRDTAWQRFLDTGPLAFLPLPGRRCSIVWSCTGARAQELLSLSDAEFDAALQTAFGESLGPVQCLSPRLSFPLSLAHASRYTDERVALIGDAAHQVHPLAGQGVNLGLADAVALADTIRTAYRAGKDIGAHAVLRRYERARKEGNLAMLAATDGLHRLFSRTALPIAGLRGVGLRVVNGVDPLKNAIMRYAMGLGRG